MDTLAISHFTTKGHEEARSLAAKHAWGTVGTQQWARGASSFRQGKLMEVPKVKDLQYRGRGFTVPW